MKYSIYYSQIGGNNTIDLTNIKPNLDKDEKEFGVKVYTSSKNQFSPMFINPLNARAISPNKSIHLIVAGLMPVLPETWKGYDTKQIFYMPNDFKPHYHGNSIHHSDSKMNITRVFLLSKNDFIDTYEASIKHYRRKLKLFNKGKSNTPIETWIHWKVPSDQKPYKNLKVKKHSIIWWDFTKQHNLNLIIEKDRFENNQINSDDINIFDPGNCDDMNVVTTIFDKVGVYYFLCSEPGHAEMGHKIQIEVIE
jgi:ribosomal protein L39E